MSISLVISNVPPVVFDSWQGRPQKPKRVLSITNRLGGKKLIIQAINTSSLQTLCLATKYLKDVSQSEVTVRGQAFVDSLAPLVGKPATWTDENGQEINKVVVVDYTTTMTAKSGTDATPFGLLIAIQITVVVDEQ